MKRISLVVALSLVGVLALSTAALADSKNGFPVNVDCPIAGAFMILEPPGSGPFVPGQVVGDNRVFVPTFFSGFDVIVKVGGEVIAVIPSPELTKGNGKAQPRGHDIETCSFTFDVTDENGVNFSGEGTVEGFLTGRP